MKPISTLLIGLAFLLCDCVSLSRADVFGSGVNSFEVEFVPIGNPGNAADTTGFPNPAGSVPYVYRIGKYEISEQMIDKANALGNLGITKDTRGPDKPATSVSWFEAASFVNWLNTSSGLTPAYKFDTNGEFQLWEPGDAGYNPNNLFRNRLARYVLPSADEWYKAAYYNPAGDVWNNFPTGGNSPPTSVAGGTASGTAVFDQDLSVGPADIMVSGGLSLFGTMGQGGNVSEWGETEFDRLNDVTNARRILRGGAWGGDSLELSSTSITDTLPNAFGAGLGFRVASIPEPPGLVLGVFSLMGLLFRPAR